MSWSLGISVKYFDNFHTCQVSDSFHGIPKYIVYHFSSDPPPTTTTLYPFIFPPFTPPQSFNNFDQESEFLFRNFANNERRQSRAISKVAANKKQTFLSCENVLPLITIGFVCRILFPLHVNIMLIGFDFFIDEILPLVFGGEAINRS